MAADKSDPAGIKKPKNVVKDLDVPEEESDEVKGGLTDKYTATSALKYK